MLGKLQASMEAKGSRMLIFSQMSRILDILEDYRHFRKYSEFCSTSIFSPPFVPCIGSFDHDDPINAIDEHNKPGGDKFIFLLTSCTGGLESN